MNLKNNALNRDKLKLVLEKIKSVNTIEKLKEYCDFSVENLFNGLSVYTVHSTKLWELPIDTTFDKAKEKIINDITRLLNELEQNSEVNIEE